MDQLLVLRYPTPPRTNNNYKVRIIYILLGSFFSTALVNCAKVQVNTLIWRTA